MLSFIGRRLVVSAALLLGASFVMYLLTAASGDPLRDLKESTEPNREQLIANRIEVLNLDTPAPLRYFLWLGGAARCLVPFADACDLGVSVLNQEVTSMLPIALGSTLRLLVGATLLAIVLGIVVGVVSALRQHSGFDYSLTFFVFLIFSLPSFFTAVLLKEFLAISFNDFLVDPRIPPPVIVGLALLAGVVAQSVVAGSWRRRLLVGGVAAAATGGAVVYISASRWFSNPGLGPVVIALATLATAVCLTALLTGLANRRCLTAGLVTAGLVVAGSVALQPLFDISTAGTLVIVAAALVAAGLVVGAVTGGVDRGAAMRIGALTAAVGYGLILVDRFMQSWAAYVNHPATQGRPIATVGAENPTLTGDIWMTGIDRFTHYLLPTIALVLVSLASYTRYVRAGMLDVLKQDYVRTARAKGVSEPVVVMRHAFRNSLIPLATFIPVDVAAIVGGAVITEQVFSISGMGQLFIRALQSVDPNPVMAYFLVVAAVVLVANLLADLSYAVLDPRIRVPR